MPLSTVRIEPEGPLDIPGSLSGLQRWGDDSIDRFDGSRWLRTLRTAGRSVPARARPAGSIANPALEVTADEADVAEAAAEMARSFVTGQRALLALCARDPVIAAAEAAHPGVRPLLTFPALDALVRSISAQQVNLRWAAEVRRRLAERYGHAHHLDGELVVELLPERLAAATVEELRALQLTTAKARSVIAVARGVADGALRTDELALLDDDAVISRLTSYYGIGVWSAEWFLARTLGRPRVVAGDLGVRKAVGRGYFDGRMPSESEVRSATAHWGAAAGIAQQLLLRGLVP